MKSDFMEILIIDDNPDITSLFSDILEDEGYKAKFVNDPKEGLELIRSQDYLIVFLDIAMPELSGLNILEQLDSEGILKEKKIVLFTATPISPTEIKLWKSKGLYGVIYKPARLVEILEVFEKIKQEDVKH